MRNPQVASTTTWDFFFGVKGEFSPLHALSLSGESSPVDPHRKGWQMPSLAVIHASCATVPAVPEP